MPKQEEATNPSTAAVGRNYSYELSNKKRIRAMFADGQRKGDFKEEVGFLALEELNDISGVKAIHASVSKGNPAK